MRGQALTHGEPTSEVTRVVRRGQGPGGQGDAGRGTPTRTEAGGSGCTALQPKLAGLLSLREEKMSGEIRGAIAVNNGKDNFPNAIPWRLGKPGTF